MGDGNLIGKQSPHGILQKRYRMMKKDNKRKHRNQMSPSEILAIEQLVHAQDKWTVGKHARKRMDTKDIPITQVMDVLRTGYVIELNNSNDLCAALRKDFGECAICVVVSLATRWVVTAWKNEQHDIHDTLDISKYKWDIDIREAIEEYA